MMKSESDYNQGMKKLRRTEMPSVQEVAVESVIARASQVIGDRSAALRWMGTPVRSLDLATPISILGTTDGVLRVTDVLGQMEHGIW